MRTVNMHEAKTHLSRLVEQAAKGDSFVIAKAGKPMVKVIALEEAEIVPEQAEIAKPRRLGFMAGEMKVPDDFDTMYQDEIERMFYGD